MKKLAFAIYDVKTEVFGMPMFFHTKAEALRAFTSEASRAESMIAAHPEDYSIFLVGSYDQSNGKLENQAPLSLGTALEYRAQSQPQLVEDDS